MKRVLDYDPGTGLKQEYHSNPGGGFTIKTYGNVAGYLRENAEDRATASKNWKGEMHQVASIPPIVWHMWWKELGDDPGRRRNRAWLAAKLNSNEFLKLRTKEGRM